MNPWRRAPRAAAIRLDEPALGRFIVLSLLLHVWFVLLFGTTTGGGSRRDFMPGDIFDVTLRPRSDESGASFRWTPGASGSTPGSALLPRERASVRPPRPETPRVNERASQPAQPPTAPDVPASEPVDAAPPAAPTVVLPVPESIQRFNPDAPEAVDKPYLPTPAPPPVPTPAPEPPTAVVPAPREARPAPTTAPRDIAPAAPPPIEREVAPAPARESLPAPARSEAPTAERSEPPAEQVPRVDVTPAPVTPARPLPTPRTPPPAVEREAAPLVDKPAPRAPPIEPARSEPIAAPPARETVPAAAPAEPAVAEPVAPREQRIVPPSTPTAPLAPAAPAAPATRIEPAPAVSPPRLRFGEPVPDEDMFKPRRDAAPAGEPGSAPRLDLEAAKRRAARDIVREGSGSHGMLSVVPPPPERESKEARALAKAGKPDCRTAYANMGLLAAVPLVASAIGNSGCRW